MNSTRSFNAVPCYDALERSHGTDALMHVGMVMLLQIRINAIVLS